MSNNFNPDCQHCSRLVGFRTQVKQQYPDYYCRPVPPFGDLSSRFLIVGLAPGKHGANATGRPFTGDFAGILLYQTLYRFGLSNLPESTSVDDELHLIDCCITNAVKCLPPANKPTTEEILTCNHYLKSEIERLPDASVILALGTIAHNAVLRALGLKMSQYKFGHGISYRISPDLQLLDSYHCSRYNTQTRRLTEAQFHAVFEKALDLVQRSH